MLLVGAPISCASEVDVDCGAHDADSCPRDECLLTSRLKYLGRCGSEDDCRDDESCVEVQEDSEHGFSISAFACSDATEAPL
jgi:hypothetical protein